MKEIGIEELKRIQIGILKHLDAFCKENNLTYFMCGGTLLGAVRHKGFIPWDDDIDIMMKREDYDKLIELYPKNDNSNFNLFSYELDKSFPYPFAKMDDCRTIFEEEINDSYKIGVNIDIFPIDYITEDLDCQHSILMKSKRLIQLLTLKRLPLKHNRSFFKNIVLFFSHVFTMCLPTSFIVSRIIKNAKLTSSNESLYRGCLVWGYGQKEILPQEVLKESIRLPFEDTVFSAPIGYDTYLKSLFGSYMVLPPIEKRQSHHSFKAYWK